MAKIFPQNLNDKVLNDPTRKSEIAVFNKLKNLKISSGMNIYYSVEWLNRNNKTSNRIDGECDFIITDKDWGVIFIEVKGGFISKDENNHWFTNDQPLKRSPLGQAKASQYEIIEEFQNRSKTLADFYYNSFAIFPDSSRNKFQKANISFDIQQFGFAEDLEQMDKLIFSFFSFRPQGLEYQNHQKLGANKQDLFHKMFTAELNLTPKISQMISQNNFLIENATSDQQKLIGSSVGEWKRLWVEGPAGSGKTSIALKKFNDNKNSFKNPYFLCRGKKLCEFLRNSSGENATRIFNFDSFLLHIATDNELINKMINKFDNQVRLELIEKIFDNSSMVNPIDFLVIDESQDFETSWWPLIESLCDTQVTIWVFGDSNQNIWGNRKPDLQNIFSPFKLTEVVRNTKQIANKSLLFYEGAGININLRGPFGTNIEIISYDEINQLQKEINRLIEIEGVQPNNIALLYDSSINNTLLSRLQDFKYIENLNPSSQSIMFSSILNFKGLEADCVFLVINDPVKISLEELYVGISRAKNFLKILTPSSMYNSACKLLREINT